VKAQLILDSKINLPDNPKYFQYETAYQPWQTLSLSSAQGS